jgi:hypothetical protein
MKKEINTNGKVSLWGLAMFLFLAVSLLKVSAQEGLNGSGGNATGTGGSVSYSIGQLLYHTHSGTNGSVAEGVQQPFEISVVTGTEDAGDIGLAVLAYPNPAADLLLLKVETLEWRDLSYQLYGLDGKLLLTNSLKALETPIDMRSYVSGCYVLRVFSGTRPIKEFKIVKN